MIRADDRALEKTPDVLKGVGVNNPAHVFFLKVTNRSVERVLVRDSVIARPFIRDYQGRFFGQFRFDESMKNFSSWFFATDLEANVAAALNRAEDYSFMIVAKRMRA